MKNLPLTAEQAKTMLKSANYIDRGNNNRRVTDSDVDHVVAMGGHLFINPQIPDQIRYFVQGGGSAPLGWLGKSDQQRISKIEQAKETLERFATKWRPYANGSEDDEDALLTLTPGEALDIIEAIDDLLVTA